MGREFQSFFFFFFNFKKRFQVNLKWGIPIKTYSFIIDPIFQFVSPSFVILHIFSIKYIIPLTIHISKYGVVIYNFIIWVCQLWGMQETSKCLLPSSNHVISWSHAIPWTLSTIVVLPPIIEDTLVYLCVTPNDYYKHMIVYSCNWELQSRGIMKP